MLGISESEKKISKLAGSNWRSGTDENQLQQAARRLRCRLPLVRKHNPDRARRELGTYLRKGIPALLCVYEWAHWVTVVKEERGRFIILDSQEKSVVTIQTWAQLKKNWVYHEPDELDSDTVHTFYDFLPLIPQFRVRSRVKFSMDRVKYLRRKSNRVLALLWDEFVSDLMEVCRVRTPLSANVISMGEFLRRHAPLILEQVDYWHGAVEKPGARKILEYLHFVADTLGMVIHKGEEKRAISAITAILSLWAAGKYGTLPVYDITRPGRKRKKR